MGATLLWSLSAITIDRLSSSYHLTSLQLSTWRVLLVLPILAAVIAVRRPAAFHLPAGDAPLFLIYGIVGIAISYVSWARSVQINTAAVAAALSFSAPAMVALGDRVLFGSRLRTLQWGAIALNLLACGLVVNVRAPAQVVHSPTGLLVGLANGLAFASYTLAGRTMAHTGRRDPLTTLFYTFGFGGLALLVWGWASEGSTLVKVHLDAGGWLLLLALTLGPTLGAYALYNLSLQTLPATAAVVITTLEPPTVAILAVVLLGRVLRPTQWIGVILIVMSVGAVQLLGRRQETRGPAEQEDRDEAV